MMVNSFQLKLKFFDSFPFVHEISQARILECLPFPSPGDIPDPGIKPTSPASPALVDGFFTIEPPGKCKTIKLGANLDDIGFGNDFLDRTPKAQSMKKKEAGLH